MATLGDIKGQLSRLLDVIKAEGFKFEDVMPEEMQDHFRDMVSLVNARAYIKEMEVNLKDLEVNNASLRAQLETKKTEMDNQPQNSEALKIDLRQSENQTDYYRQIANHEQFRADVLERKLTEATRSQAAASEDARRIKRLEDALTEREIATVKLFEENQMVTNRYEIQREETLKLIEEKEDAVIALRNYANQLEVEKSQVDEASEQMNDALNSIIDSLEQQTHSTAKVANSKTVMFYHQRDFNDKLLSTILSELMPLGRFYSNITEALVVYQSIIKNLSGPHSDIVTIPQSLDTILMSAQDQLNAYKQISTDLRNESDLLQYGLAQEAVVSQVEIIADGAQRLYANLQTCKTDMVHFLKRLSDEPNTRSRRSSGFTMRTLSLASSRTSISSFASFKKRLF